MKKSVLLAAAILSGLLMMSAGQGAPYKIGAIFSITGKASSLGKPESQTVEMLAAELNANGGINGHKLQVIISDDEGDDKKAVAQAKKLFADENVLAIIGPTISGSSLAVADLAEQARVPNISCAASWKILKDLNTGKTRQWVFKTAQSDAIVVNRLFEYFQKHGISKVAIITVANPYGSSGRQELNMVAAAYNIEIVADQTYQPGETALTEQLAKIKSSGAEAVVNWDTSEGAAAVAKAIRGSGSAVKLFMSHGVVNRQFIDLAGEAAEGVILPASKIIVAEQLPDKDPQKKLLLDYKKKFEAKYGPVSSFGGHAYDAFEIVTKAIEKAGPDRQAIRDEIEKTKGYVGATGIFNMTASDHEGLTKQSFAMVKIQGGNWKMLED
jgi:branched-chain amino acid transport system substrate-binding protein